VTSPNGSPLVSVLIPAFNRVHFIEETLNSVLEQDYPNIQLIVVDDGSTDGTYERLRHYAEQGMLTLLNHPERMNRGQSASLNLALEAARGDYIGVLDSDDCFLPGKLRKQVDYLEAHPDIGLVYGMGEAIDEDGKWLYDIHGTDHVEPNDPNAVLLDCYMLLPQNSLVRASVYEQVGFFEETFRASQDHDMLIRMAEVTRFAFIPQKLFQYRRHGDSISSRGAERRWKTGFEILRRARRRYPYRRSTIRRRSAVLHFRMGQVCLDEGKVMTAVSYFVKSGVLDPARAFRVISGRERVS